MGLIARPWVDITLVDKKVGLIEAGILQSQWMLVSLQGPIDSRTLELLKNQTGDPTGMLTQTGCGWGRDNAAMQCS